MATTPRINFPVPPIAGQTDILPIQEMINIIESLKSRIKVLEEKDKANQQELELAEDEEETMRDLVFQKVAFALKWVLFATWLIHCHIFWCFGALLDLKVLKDDASDFHIDLTRCLMYIPGPLITPGLVVLIINDVAGAFDEIQSYQIAYILWGIFIGFIYIAFILTHWTNIRRPSANEKNLAEQSKPTESGGTEPVPSERSAPRDLESGRSGTTEPPDPDGEDREELFCKLLMRPFGVHAIKTGESFNFVVPLVALAPAIVGGFIANFVLEKTYSLECDAEFNAMATICEGEGADRVCCVTVSNHENWIDFGSNLAASILLAWGYVKYMAWFILEFDDEVELEEQPMIRQRTVSRHGPSDSTQSVH